MRDKTRKRLRKCTYPVRWIWLALSVIIGYSGALLVMLAYTMLGDLTEAKRVLGRL